MLKISEIVNQSIWEYQQGNLATANAMLDFSIKLAKNDQKKSSDIDKLVKSKGVKIETTLKKCLQLYHDHMFDLNGSWNFEDLVGADAMLNFFPKEILDLPVTIDGKHVVIDMPNTGTEVFNMIPEDLINTTLG